MIVREFQVLPSPKWLDDILLIRINVRFNVEINSSELQTQPHTFRKLLLRDLILFQPDEADSSAVLL